MTKTAEGNNEKEIVPDRFQRLIERARDDLDHVDKNRKEIEKLLSKNAEDFRRFIISIQQRIREMAFELAQAAGNQPAKEVEYWVQAQQNVFGPLHARIEERAYFLWERSGRDVGRALDHWLEAEKEILGPIWTCTRDVAYLLWLEGKRQRSTALEIWRMAEKMVWPSLTLGLDLFPLFQPHVPPKNK